MRITAEHPWPARQRRMLRRALQRMLAELAPGRPLELSVILVDDRRMAELNREYREIEEPTDVLAFPQLDAAEVSAMLLSGAAGDATPEPLGDIVIDLPVAERQASERGVAQAVEVEWLAAHGLLHLLGYEDESESGAAAMAAKASELTGGEA